MSALTGYEPDLDSMRRDVTALASRARSSARPGELACASWIETRLRELGVADVRVERYRYQHSYALAHSLHNLAGLAAVARGGRLGAALAGAALWSYERETSGASQWLRPLLPASEGANVLARIAAQESRSGTFLLVAHHDAANTGLIWSPRLVAAGAARHLRRRRVDPFMAPVELAFALALAGSLAKAAGRASRLARTAAAALLAAATAVDADVGRSATVPGACDNASGVAACLDLTRALTADPPRRSDVLVLFTGAEEAGMGGMAAFLRAHERELRSARSFVLGLDTIAAGAPIVACGEGAMREQRYRERDIALVERGAALAGLARPERWRLGGWTDPVLAVHRSIRSASLLSMGPGYFPNYHHPDDIPAHLDWDCLSRCARIAAGTLRVWEAEAAG